jgi:HSP20 family molecular chaperone IbpA
MKEGLIRRQFDEKSGVWYFSIVDVIAEMTDSASPTNYWKVLKNRLRKSGDQLVTECNQLKMKATDGKSYLTDCGKAETVIGILELIPKARIHAFMALENSLTGSQNSEKNEEKTTAKLLVDMYEKDGSLIIETFLADISPENIKVVAGRKKVLIEGKIQKEKQEFSYDELPAGKFSRTIALPYPIKPSIEKTFDRGHLKIKLEKI